MTKQKAVVCPYCGHAQHLSEGCRACGGRFSVESRRATRDEMGPWFIRDPAKPFRPGCSHDTVQRLVERGRITRYTVMRGPTTRQFWTVARRIPGVAHLLGYCHACDAPVAPSAAECPRCRASFAVDADRDRLGLVESADGGADAGETFGISIAELLRPDPPSAPSRRLSAFVPEHVTIDGDRLEEVEVDDDLDEPSSRTRPVSGTGAARAEAEVDPDENRMERLTLQTLERSLRRTVERQRYTIQALFVGTGLLVVAFVVVLIVVAGRPTSTEPPTNGSATPAHGPAAGATPPAEVVEEPASRTDQDSAAESAVDAPDVRTVDELEAAVTALVNVRDAPIERIRQDGEMLLDRLLAAQERADSVANDTDLTRIIDLIDRLETALAEAELRHFLQGEGDGDGDGEGDGDGINEEPGDGASSSSTL